MQTLFLSSLLSSKYKILPRSEVEKMVHHFIVNNKIYAEYGVDSEGLFQVNFLVKENEDDT